MSNENILDLINSYIEFSKKLEENDRNVLEISNLIRNSDEELINEYYEKVFDPYLITTPEKYRNVIPFFRIITLNKIQILRENSNYFKAISDFLGYVQNFKEKLKSEQFPDNFLEEINNVQNIKPFSYNGNEYNFNIDFIRNYVEIKPDRLNRQFMNYGTFNFFRHFKLYHSTEGKQKRNEYQNLWDKLFYYLVDLLEFNPEEYIIGQSPFFKSMAWYESDDTWGALIKREIGELSIEEDIKKSFQLYFDIKPEGLVIGTYLGANSSEQMRGYLENNINSKREILINLFKNLKRKYLENIKIQTIVNNQTIEYSLDGDFNDETFQEEIFDLYKINLSIVYTKFQGNKENFDELVKELFQIYSILAEQIVVIEERHVFPPSFLEKNLKIYDFLEYKEEIIQKLKEEFIGIEIKTIVEKILRILNSGKNLILIGAPGTGKTRILEIIFKILDANYDIIKGTIFTTATSDWTLFETIGGLIPRGRRLDFQPGIFLKCFKEKNRQFTNKWLIVDELNRANIDKVFGYFFSLLSDQEVELPFTTINQKIVKIIPINKWKNENISDNRIIEKINMDSEFDSYFISPNWRMGGTINSSDKASLHQLSHAFIRRFGFVDIPVPDIDDFMREYSSKFKSSNEKQEQLKKIWKSIKDIFKIGPAITIDMDKLLESPNIDIFDAFEAYILPQIDTLPDDIFNRLMVSLKTEFGGNDSIGKRFDKYKIKY